MSDEFSDDLARLMAKYIPRAHRDGDNELGGEMLERLVHSLGTTIALLGRGDKDVTQALLTGCEQQLYEVVSDILAVIDAMDDLTKSAGGPAN